MSTVARTQALCLLFAIAFATLPLPLQTQEPVRLQSVTGLDEYFAIPDDNPLTLARIELGRRLFFDRALSRDRTIACATCHRPAYAFADTVRMSSGAHARVTRRNSPAIVNRAYGSLFFWDGRASSLESQVVQPIRDSSEMDLPLSALVARLAADSSYRGAFAVAFRSGVDSANVARALASYVRTIRSGDAPIDHYRDGDTTAVSPAARRGALLFFGRANCSSCHVGPNFTDEKLHNTGISVGTRDRGRAEVTRAKADIGAFKTPTLREVARTAPYMHDGSLPTLEAVVDFYDRGGRANANLDREIQPLGLTAENKRDLIAFLRSLSSPSIICGPIMCVP